jgi:hypothetical protein
VNSKSPDQILSDWDAIFSANSSIMENELQALEESNRSKYGPRSLAKPWSERVEGVREYFTDDTSKYEPDPIEEVKRHTLRPISTEKALTFIRNNTNSGLPYFTRRGDLKEIYLQNELSL